MGGALNGADQAAAGLGLRHHGVGQSDGTVRDSPIRTPTVGEQPL